MYKGIVIKETLNDDSFLDYVKIDKVEICKTNQSIRYWTLVHFHSETVDLPQRLAKVIIDRWFGDIIEGNIKYIILKDQVLSYEIGNASEKKKIVDYCCSLGFQKEQFNWEG